MNYKEFLARYQVLDDKYKQADKQYEVAKTDYDTACKDHREVRNAFDAAPEDRRAALQEDLAKTDKQVASSSQTLADSDARREGAFRERSEFAWNEGVVNNPGFDDWRERGLQEPPPSEPLIKEVDRVMPYELYGTIEGLSPDDARNLWESAKHAAEFGPMWADAKRQEIIKTPGEMERFIKDNPTTGQEIGGSELNQPAPGDRPPAPEATSSPAPPPGPDDGIAPASSGGQIIGGPEFNERVGGNSPNPAPDAAPAPGPDESSAPASSGQTIGGPELNERVGGNSPSPAPAAPAAPGPDDSIAPASSGQTIGGPEFNKRVGDSGPEGP